MPLNPNHPMKTGSLKPMTHQKVFCESHLCKWLSQVHSDTWKSKHESCSVTVAFHGCYCILNVGWWNVLGLQGLTAT